MAPSATPAAITAQAVTAAEGRIKLPKPMTFNGTRSKLKTFLVNMDMHLDASNLTDEKKKIIFVALCFTDAAAEWIQPILSDYYGNVEEDWNTVTQDLFTSYKKFKEKITKAFRNIDKQQTAERQLRYLRQTGSV
ncbi:hypothetical protein PISL3812_08013 [Talaromyces islandicus]|uniref:Ty3 transposon capsid-like protein domain-containing protein n=1 Tax=Talaromyces islandicus TaxID=28573 RepID=A0A0U1M602_TALIS|nr:hypothetical protein PISL3812_08013 [Talaromyces islandicus]